MKEIIKSNKTLRSIKRYKNFNTINKVRGELQIKLFGLWITIIKSDWLLYALDDKVEKVYNNLFNVVKSSKFSAL